LWAGPHAHHLGAEIAQGAVDFIELQSAELVGFLLDELVDLVGFGPEGHGVGGGCEGGEACERCRDHDEHFLARHLGVLSLTS
jgi:hypothetical protein